MKKNNNSFWKVLFFAEIILLIKIFLNFFIDGPFLLPDETCVINKANYFIHNFEYLGCKEITNLPRGGNPSPLYILLISPLFLLNSKLIGFKLALALNSLLVSSLVFPLYSFFKKATKNNGLLLLLTGLVLFLPQVSIFEKTIMTETLFLVLSIWTLHFYSKSFEKNSSKNKIIAFILSILCAFTRPYGFIMPIAITISEILNSKKKKTALLFLLPISIILVIIPIFILFPGVQDVIVQKFSSLNSLDNWKLIIVSIKNQLNSLSITTYSVLLIVFLNYLFNKKSLFFKYRHFIITFIFLNFIISAQHIYGYLLVGKYDPNLLTRYINVSIVFVIIISLREIIRIKKFDFSKFGIISTILIISGLIFLGKEGATHNLNIDLSIFLKPRMQHPGSDLVVTRGILEVIIIPISAILAFLLFNNKKKLLLSALTLIMIAYSIPSIVWISSFFNPPALQKEFQEMSKNITVVYKYTGVQPRTEEIISLSGTTDNNYRILILGTNKNDNNLPIELIEQYDEVKDADYILSTANINLPIEKEIGQYLLYKYE